MKQTKRILAALLICIFAVTAVISADTNNNQIKDLQKQLENNNKQLQQTQNAINKTKTQQKEVSKQVEELDHKLQAAEKELEEVEEQLANLESQIAITQRELERATQDAEGQKELLKKRVRVMYETGTVGYLAVVLDSTSFGDFVSRVDYLKKIVDYDLNLLKEMKENRDNIAEKEAQLQSELAEKEVLKQQIADKKNDVASALEERETLLNQLTKNLKEYEKQYDKLLEQSKEIERMIVQLQSNGKYAGGQGAWPVPSSTRITSPYGYRIHPILKTKKMHTGIDIGAASGSSVVAFNSGTVIFSGYNGGYGNTVIIDHGGKISTLYAHNSKLLVKVGDKVEKGQVIAKVGSTGLSTGPHLHFEVRVNGQHTDPMPYLGK